MTLNGWRKRHPICGNGHLCPLVFAPSAIKCRGCHFFGVSENLEMSGNSAEVSEKSGKRPKVRERSRNLCGPGKFDCGCSAKCWQPSCGVVEIQSQLCGHVLRSSCNLPELCSYRNSFCMRDVHGEFRSINVHLFDILPAISSGKVGGKFREFFLSGDW